MKMNRKIICISIISMFLLTSITSLSVLGIKTSGVETLEDPKTIYVDDDNTEGPWDGTQEHPYQHIQEAIGAASDGDTVFVYSGIYNEKIVIEKSIILKGENRDTTIIDGSGYGDVIEIHASSIKIEGFLIQNGKGFGKAGIKAIKMNPCLTDIQVSNCIIKDNNKGICLRECSRISIDNCEIVENYDDGIQTSDWIDDIEISNCDLIDNAEHGIGIHTDYTSSYFASNIFIHDCNILDNMYDGISFQQRVKNVEIFNNNINDNSRFGIFFVVGIDVNIFNNEVIGNSDTGIAVLDHSENQEDSTNICIHDNTISNNNNYGIHLQYTSGNIVYNNRLDNNGQNAFNRGSNTWYDSDSKKGNWWSDYAGKDDDKDGIGDIPYVVPDLDANPLNNDLDLYPTGKFKKERSFCFKTYNILHSFLENNHNLFPFLKCLLKLKN